MLSANPAGVRTEGRSICLVAERLDGGPGAHAALTAQALAEAGWRVHVLCCDRAASLRGCSASWIGACEMPSAFTVPCQLRQVCIDRSEHVRLALEELHRTHCFDVIEFPDRGALGFRAVQARRMGSALTDVRLLVKLHGSSQSMRNDNEDWPAGETDLMLDYCERYAFDKADIQASCSSSLLDAAASIGWNVRTDACILADSAEEYSRLVQDTRAKREASLSAPLVTVALPYYHLPEYLPETLASLAAQTWQRLEVFVIDDGSSDAEAVRVFEQTRGRYPQFRFLTQPNAGIGAARNRALSDAQGEFFVCVDADNIAHPEMIERFVRGMRHRPDCSALSCYFLAFTDSERLARSQFEYAYRPPGGPHVAAALHNVYGDANAIFRTADFRAVGGFETDRGTSYEDWEAFVKLVNAGKRVDVLPEHLFCYRHRPGGFSRITNDYRNRQRVLRQFRHAQQLPLSEQLALWQSLAGAHLQLTELRARQQSLRYRLADKLCGWLRRVPFLTR